MTINETPKIPPGQRTRNTLSVTVQKPNFNHNISCLSPNKTRNAQNGKSNDVYTNFIHSFCAKASSPLRTSKLRLTSNNGSPASTMKASKLGNSFNARATFQNRSQTPTIMRQINEQRHAATSVKGITSFAIETKRTAPWNNAAAYQSQTEQ